MAVIRLARALKEQRQAAGLTVQQVADHVGVSHQAAAAWERETGGNNPSRDKLDAIASLYGIQADALVERALELEKAGYTPPPPVPTGDRSRRFSPKAAAVFQRPLESEAATAYADLLRGYTALAQGATAQLRLWELALSGISGMREQLEAFAQTAPSAAAMVIAYSDFTRREQILMQYAIDFARNGRTAEADLGQLGSVSVLNQALFAAGLQPESLRPTLSRDHPNRWLQTLGLAAREDAFQNMRVVFQIGSLDRAELRDEHNRLVTFFDGRLLSD